MGLLSSSPAEKEIYKFVGGFFLRSFFTELLRLNDLYEKRINIGTSIQKHLEEKTKSGELDVRDIESELYLLLKKAIYLNKLDVINNDMAKGFSKGECPKCHRRMYNMKCSCGYDFFKKVDDDEVLNIKIRFPTDSRSPYNTRKANNLEDYKHKKIDREIKLNNEKKIMKKVPDKYKQYSILNEGTCFNCNDKTSYLELHKDGFLSINQVFYCTKCKMALEQFGDEYKLAIAPNNNKHMQSYKDQTLTMSEWKEIAKGGLSNKEIEHENDHKEGLKTYEEGVNLFRKGNYKDSKIKFNFAKSKLSYSSMEHELSTIFCCALDLVSLNESLEKGKYHKRSFKSLNFNFNMALNSLYSSTQRLEYFNFEHLRMANGLIKQTLLKIPENNFYNLNFRDYDQKDIAESWKKIAETSLKIDDDYKLDVLIGMIEGQLHTRGLDDEPYFDKAIKKAGNKDPEIYITIGKYYADECHRFRQAIFYFTKALQFPNMKTYENYITLGSLYGLDNNHEDAIYFFDKAIECEGVDFDVFGRKAHSLLKLGEYDEAQECFDEFFRRIDIAIQKNPRDIELLRAKAVTLSSIGRKREALDTFLKIEEIDPNADFLKLDLIRLGF